MREQVGQSKKATTSFSIPTLKQPTRGFGLELLDTAPQATTEVESVNPILTHDISRISLRPQAKLSISQPGDFYEQQADSVAQQVMRRMAQPVNRQSIQRQQASDPEDLQMKSVDNFHTSWLQRQQAPEEEELQMKPLVNTITPLVQRQQAPDPEDLQMKSVDNSHTSWLQRQQEPEEEEIPEDTEVQKSSMVQRRPSTGGIAATDDLETSIQQSRGGGQPLADDIKQPMEQAFGADFSSVNIHTDDNSDKLNKSIQARAFTTGQDIFFRQGEYSPGSNAGKELLAHELTHVVQQNGSTVQRKIEPQEQPQSKVESEIKATKLSSSIQESEIQRLCDECAAETEKKEDIIQSKGIEDTNSTQSLTAPAPTTETAPVAEVPTPKAEVPATPTTETAPVTEVPTPKAEVPATPTTEIAPVTEVPAPKAEVPATPTTEIAPVAEVPAPKAEVTPAMPESPALAETAQQIIQGVENEKTQLSQDAQVQRATLMQQSEDKVKAIEAITQTKLQAITTDLETKETQIKQRFSAGKVTITEQINAQKVGIQAEGSKGISDLDKEVESKRKVAIDAAQEQAKQMEQSGVTEAKRINSASTESDNKVKTTAKQTTSRYGGKSQEVQSAVRQAVGQAFTEIGNKLSQKSQNVVKDAQDAAQKTAQELRASGQKFALGLGNNKVKLGKSLEQGTQAAIQKLTAAGAQQIKSLDVAQEKAIASLKAIKSAAIPQVIQSGQAAQASARKNSQAAIAQVNQTETGYRQQLDQGVSQIVGKLGQVPKDKKINNKEVQKFTQQATGQLQQARLGINAGLTQVTSNSQSELNKIDSLLSQHQEGIQQQVSTSSNQAITTTDQGLTQANQQLTQTGQQILTKTQSANQEAIAQVGTQIQSDIDKAKQGWSEQKDKAQGEIQNNVNKEITNFTKTDQTATTDLNKVAENTAEQVESPIWSGIKQGALRFLEGLSQYAWLVIVGFVMAVVILGSVAAAIAALPEILLIAGIALLITGFIVAFDQRLNDFAQTLKGDEPWYLLLGYSASALGWAVLDVFGVGALIEGIAGENLITGKKLSEEERAEKITEGVLTLLTMGLLHLVFKGGGKPGEVKPGEVKDPIDPSKDPVDPSKPGEVKPGEVKDPIDPSKDPVDPSKDPFNARNLGLSDRATKALTSLENLKKDPVGEVNSQANHNHYKAARRETAGEIVAKRPDGKPYSHVGDLQRACDGLYNVRDALEAEIRNPPDSITSRGIDVLDAKFREVRILINQLNGFLSEIGHGQFPPYHEWKPGSTPGTWIP